MAEDGPWICLLKAFQPRPVQMSTIMSTVYSLNLEKAHSRRGGLVALRMKWLNIRHLMSFSIRHVQRMRACV